MIWKARAWAARGEAPRTSGCSDENDKGGNRTMTIRMRGAVLSIGLSLAAFAAGSATARAETLELMHFWTSGGEANAMQVIKDAAEKAGITWQDAAVAGGAGMNAYQVLQARIAAGNPPAGMQMHSAQIRQFAKEGL